MARQLRWAATFLALATTWASLAPTSATAAPRHLDNRLVRLSPKPHLPEGARRVGQVDAKRRFSLTIGLAPRHQQAFNAFVEATSTPGNAQFRHFLRRGEYARRFGPTPSSIAALVHGLHQAGFTVSPLTPARQSLHASGTASAIATFFHTGLAGFVTSDGVHHFSATKAAMVPSSIRDLITGVSGLGSFSEQRPRTAPLRRPALAAPSCSAATASANTGYGFTTTQLANAYGLDHFYANGATGQTVTVGIYELARYKLSDLTTYASCFGVTPKITNVNVDGGPPAYSASAEAIEPTLDIEQVLSVAPAASILVYQAPNGTAAHPSAPNDLLAKIAADDLAQVVTTSWGLCEADNPDPGGVNFENGLFKQMAAQGQTFIASSGDNGPADCAPDGSNPIDTADAVDDPASQPYVTGVGAIRTTSFTPLVQSAWGRGSLGGGGSGGGLSAVWSKPSWQVVSSTDQRVVSTTKRMVPDVALNGDPRSGVLIYQADQGGWFPVGGTSAAAPLLAALVALTESNCQKSVAASNVPKPATGARNAAKNGRPSGSNLSRKYNAGA